MLKKKTNLILFGKELSREGFKYHLYFTDETTLDSQYPRLYRLTCLRKKTFSESDLGKVYDVSYRRRFLNTLSEAGEIEITEDVFQKLLKQRDNFKQQLLSPFFRYSTAQNYYTFEEIKQILAFKPERIKSFGCSGFCTFLHFLSFVIPFILFLYSSIYYYMDFLPSKFWHAKYYLLLPAYYFLSVPLLIYIMRLFYILSDRILWHYEGFRKILIQKEVYRNGGLRQGIQLNHKQKSRLVLYGILFGGVYIVFWLVMLL